MSASARPPDIPGYRYLRQLAVGGYSVVYLYAQDSPKREVAVKVLKDVGQILLDQLVDEANAMARLGNHPNIVQVLATAVASDGQHYIVMPYCSGPNLLALAQRGGFDGRKVLRVGVQIARAVEASHRAGFVHRDIKPANILTDEYGTPRLTDFGIAGRLVPDDQAEEVGISVPWSPPEILAGGAGSVASDVYSLGATLWNLLVGHSPFEVAGRNSRPEVAARIRRVPAPPTGRTDVPVAVEALLARMLAKQPAGRPPSAEDVARELERIERDLGGPVAVDWPWHPDNPVPRSPLSRSPLSRGTTGTADLDDTADRPRRSVAPSAPAPLPEPVLARTELKERPVPPEPAAPEPARSRAAWWLWGSAAALVALAATVAAIGLGSSAGGTRPPRVSTVDSGGGGQDAGALGDNAPPGVPAVTAARTDPMKLRFTWTYSAQLASDTFNWRTADSGRTGTATSAAVELTDPAGTELCLQVKVIRADGSHATVDWSPAGCGR